MIQVNNLHKSFGETEVLKGITTNIEKGEVVVVIGPSGSGKSTFLRCLNMLEEATSGEIYVDGEHVNAKGVDVNLVRQKMGMVFQHFNLFPHLKIIDNITLAPVTLGKMTKEDAEKKAMELLDRVGLADKAQSYPVQLSGGQKRRVAIAGILAMEPEVIVLDEPTAGLDPKGRDEILDLVAELHQVRKITVVLVSHSMEDVAKYVDRLVVMDHGKKAFDGTPKEVFAHYKELEEIGLAAPQVTYIMHALAEHGMNVKTDATTIEEAATEIMRSIHG